MYEMKKEIKNYAGFSIPKIWQILKSFSGALSLSINLSFLKIMYICYNIFEDHFDFGARRPKASIAEKTKRFCDILI